MSAQRIHAGAVAGVAPAGRHLLGEHPAQIVLDVEVVDDPIAVGRVVDLDVAAIVLDRPGVLADAEAVSRRSTALVRLCEEDDRPGHIGLQQLPVDGARFGIDHRPRGHLLLVTPLPVDGLRHGSLEALHGI